MNTYHLNLINDPAQNTDTTVHWMCTACGNFTNFSREGFSASESEYPEGGDQYWGNGECIPALRYIKAEEFYGYFTDAELVALTTSPHDVARATVFRLQQMVNGIPVNHPLLINSLRQLEGLGILAEGRTDEIVAHFEVVNG
jgi:hypothetical protein